MSILEGVGLLVDDWLEVAPKGQPPYYRHKTAANELSTRTSTITGTREFLELSYRQIDNNWQKAKESGLSRKSNQNWRWKRHLELSPKNQSPELLLERKIVNEGGENWSNQMPVASGLVGPATDKRAAVDLVRRENETKFTFIELKVGSDNPLFAAIEILLYGLLFVWSKNNVDVLGYDAANQPVLAATEVTLCILAPDEYYSGYKLTNVSEAIDSALQDFGNRNQIKLNFVFNQFESGKIIGASVF
ncbi:MAG: hypothetical protein ACJAR0_003693 [Candidatus Azotimanducaceae bacterium]|jgi:hypothetical protein